MTVAITPLLWAVAAITPAAIAGFIVLIVAQFGRLTITEAALMAGVVRLLIAIIGSAIIIFFTNVNVLPFLVWLTFLYFVVLGAEVYFAVWKANNTNNLEAKV